MPSGTGISIVSTSVTAAPTGSPQQLARHHDPLHLVGALVDLGDLGVAHHPLDGVVAGVAVAAEHLDGVRGDLHRDVGGEALGGGAEEREVLVVALRAAGGGVGQLAGGLDLHAHVGEQELQSLEVGDRLAELLPLLGVGQRVVDRALRDADGLGGDGDPGVVEGAHRGLEAGALLADHPVGGDPDLVEVDLAGGAALDAELLLRRAERDTLVGLLDHERRDALRRGASGSVTAITV